MQSFPHRGVFVRPDPLGRALSVSCPTSPGHVPLPDGRARVRPAPEWKRVLLTAGDIVILPHGDAHFLGNGSPESPWTPSGRLQRI